MQSEVLLVCLQTKKLNLETFELPPNRKCLSWATERTPASNWPDKKHEDGNRKKVVRERYYTLSEGRNQTSTVHLNNAQEPSKFGWLVSNGCC